MEQNTVQKPDCAAITAQARQAAEELLAAAHLRAGDIFVVGCSSSEIVGGHIGKDSSMEAAAAVPERKKWLGPPVPAWKVRIALATSR